MKKQNEQLLRKLPSVDTLLKDPELQSCIAGIGRNVVVNSIREAVDEIREEGRSWSRILSDSGHL